MEAAKAFILSKGGILGRFYIAEANGGVRRSFVDYTCEHGHANVKKRVDSLGHGKGKGWCNPCQNNTIDDAHNLALKMGGKFLSTQFTNTATKYTWECENGHQFDSKYTNVHAGKWCPHCLRYCKDDMIALAATKEGCFFQRPTRR
jgi:hypothetical protein